jgi:phage gp45-like
MLGVLGPSRPVPRVGASARITYFGGGTEHGVVIGVHDEGRRLEVRGESGETIEFVLSPATAKFVVAGAARTERLELL